MSKIKRDLVGERFGYLTVVERANPSATGMVRWLCRCECGTTKLIQGSSLTNGYTKSCGCHRNDNKRRHGHHTNTGKTGEYNSWCGMKQRCYNPGATQYKDYGGRGITVCERWRDSFENFLLDVGPSPGPGYSIDRINNDGNYEPGNVRWATAKEQAVNRRKEANQLAA